VVLTDLSRTPFAEVLRRVSAEQRSGDLQVRSGKMAKTLFLDHGRVVFAASNLRKDRLGEALVALGRITDADFQRASALMKEGDRRRRFGEALIQAGVMDAPELGKSVARQVKHVVLSLFALDDGAASFEDRPCPIPLEYMVSLSVHRLLYIGIKSMKNQDLVLAGLGDLDRWVMVAEVPPFRFGVRKCPAEELEILEQSRRRVTVRRLAWAPGGPTATRLRACYALLSSGVLQDAGRQPAVPAPPPQMETSTFLLSALRHRPDPSARDAIRQEVHAELESSGRLDRESWLKVSRGAPRGELIRALEEKMDRYHALREAVADDDALRTDIEVVLGRASSMLRLARQGTAGAEAPPPASASSPVPAAETVAAALVPEAAPAAAPAPAPPRPSSGPPGSSNFTGSAQIEHLLMEGHIRMTVADYANAVKVYERLVNVEPDVPAYRVKLAIAMAFYPPQAKQAEREFFEALRLDPKNADLHYQFGLYYKKMRVRSRAIVEMQTAVRLNPRHKGAREELEILSPRDSALTSLRKLFK
jgi:tetratricopeptide (TPR) repeat protein